MVLDRTRSAVLQSLRGEPDGLTRPEIVQASLLSRPTVAKVVDVLLAERRVRELAGDRVALAPASGLYIGLDIGHGHVAAAVGTGSAEILAGPRSSPEKVDVDRIGAAALKPAMALVRELIEDENLDVQEIRGIGVGIPAPLNRQGKVASSAYLPSFIDIDVTAQVLRAFRAEFGEELSPNVSCDNDANLGVLGETMLGVAPGCRNAVYVKCSTGIGAGILIGGRLWHGHHLFAGELGHTTVSVPHGADWFPLDTTTCERCLQPLCLESTSSATALVAQLHALDPGAYDADLDFDALVDDIVSRPMAHPLAREALRQAGARIGAALGNVVRFLDPEVVILGGKLARAGGIVRQPVADAVANASIGDGVTTVAAVAPDQVRFSEARGGVVLGVQAASDKLLAS